MRPKWNTVFLRVVYTLCFVALCIIDWMAGCMAGRVQFVSTNCTGIVIAIIILSGYRFKDFLKPVYAVWLGLSLILAPLAVYYGFQYYPYRGQWLSGVVNVCIYGFIAIRVITRQLVEKKKANIRWIVFFIWLAMMVLMVVSKNEAIWPLWFSIMFGSVYLTEYRREQEKFIYIGLVDGVIIAFFLIQGAALLFRPYDMVGYRGMYLNCNMNALFYVMVFCAFLCKYIYLTIENKKVVWKVLTLLFAGSMFGFVVLTGSRTAFFTLIITLIPFLICLVCVTKRKIGSIVGHLAVLLAVGIISIPISYTAVRYVPTIHLHPIFFMNEYNSSERVHSGEDRNSDKYISFDFMIRVNIGKRFSDILPKPVSDALDYIVPPLDVYAAETNDDSAIVEPLIPDGGDVSGLSVRYQIHKWYFTHLNVFGHRNSEHGVQLTSYYYAPHAHNWWLQMAFNFGIPVGVILIAGVVLYVKTYFSLLIYGDCFYACILGLFITIFLTFGFFEADYFLGQFPFTLFFMLFVVVIKCRPEKLSTETMC